MMKKRIAIALLSCTISFIYAQDKSIEKINKVFEENQFNDENLIGSSFMVFKNDSLAFQRSFGYADIQNKIPFNENTVIGLGSLSKLYTSIAIMQLIDQNKIAYETTLGDIFNDIPEYCKGITIRNLLENSSGLPNLYTSEKIKEKFYFNYKEVFKYYEDFNQLSFAPGEKQMYNQMDYAILVLVVEKVSKKSFEKYLTKYIFKPLKLENTYLIGGQKKIQNLAKRYFSNRENEIEELKNFSEILPIGFTGIYTSPKEFIKFLEGFHSGRLVKMDHLKTGFTKPYFVNLSGAELPRFSFAGINKELYSISHKFLGGADAGYSIIMLRVPYDNTTSIVFTNNAGLFDMYRLGKQVSNSFSKVFIYVEPPKGKLTSPVR